MLLRNKMLINPCCCVGIPCFEPKVCDYIVRMVLMLIVLRSKNVVIMVVTVCSRFNSDDSICDCLLTSHSYIQENDRKLLHLHR